MMNQYTDEEVRKLVWDAFEAGWIRRAAYTGLDYDYSPTIYKRFKLWSEAKNVFKPLPNDELYIITLSPANVKAVALDTKWSEEELMRFYYDAKNQGRAVKICVTGLRSVVLQP
jgi:hypothetical protein